MFPKIKKPNRVTWVCSFRQHHYLFIISVLVLISLMISLSTPASANAGVLSFSLQPGVNFQGSPIRPGQGTLYNAAGGLVEIPGYTTRTEIYGLHESTWNPAGRVDNFFFSHTATLLQNGQVLVVGGNDGTGNDGGAPNEMTRRHVNLYDPYHNTWQAAAPLIQGRSRHTATLLQDGSVLVVGGEAIPYEHSIRDVERYNPATNTWTPGPGLHTGSFDHTATLLPDGRVLVVGGCNCNDDISIELKRAELYDPVTGTWSQAADMNQYRRWGFTATLLPDGRVLVVGGYASLKTSPSTTAEIYDPIHNTWTMVAGPQQAHINHTATLLNDGRVLVAGGRVTYPSTPSNAELYDPVTNTWSPAGAMQKERSGHRAVLLPNGQVMAAGGIDVSGNAIDSVELYDLITNQWVETLSFQTGRTNHSLTLLSDGRVLAAGGMAGNYSELINNAEIYNLANDTWTTASPMPGPRSGHTATLLLDGNILVASGDAGMREFQNSIFVYHPATNTWENAGSVVQTRISATATVLFDGRVLLADGQEEAWASLWEAEIYDPQSKKTTPTSPPRYARRQHTATLLPDGQVLLSGGCVGDGEALRYLNSAERYNPGTDTWTEAAPMHVARCGHHAVLLQDGRVLVAGGDAGGGTTELYNPSANTWQDAPPLSNTQGGGPLLLLQDGRVLALGDGEDLNNEVYDPAANVWTPTAPRLAARSGYSAALLPDGRILVAAGQPAASNSAEIYNPWLDAWNASPPPPGIRYGAPMVVQPDGQALMAGGKISDYDSTALAFRFSPNPLIQPAWRPVLNPVSTPLVLGEAVSLSGQWLRGYKMNDAGDGFNTHGGAPLVQLRRLDNNQTIWLRPAAFDASSYQSLPLGGIQPGPAMLTVWVNGIPSVAEGVVVHPPRLVTQVQLAASGQTTPAGKLTLMATVMPASVKQACTVTGQVTFRNLAAPPGSQVLGSRPLGTDCQAVLVLDRPVPGSYAIKAEYGGDSGYLPASSAILNVHVPAWLFLPLLSH